MAMKGYMGNYRRKEAVLNATATSCLLWLAGGRTQASNVLPLNHILLEFSKLPGCSRATC